MENPTGEPANGVLRLDFDRRLMLQFRGSTLTSDAGLLTYREFDDALGLSVIAGSALADTRTGRNGRRALPGLLRQFVFGRLREPRRRRAKNAVCRDSAADRQTAAAA